MPDERARYAIYFVPAADSDLYRLGSSILGYDCYTGEELPPPPELRDDAEFWRTLTAEPRRYGFHATLKAPFRLGPSCSEAQLVTAFFDFVESGPRVSHFAPEVRMIGGFAAVVPRQPSPVLSALADQCTTAFDAFRAPMSAEDMARRASVGLSPRQMDHLQRWGYPYVFADFRFHMTLTGQIPPDRCDRVLAALRASFSRVDARPVAIDRIALLKQEGQGAPFRVLCHAELEAMTSTGAGG